MAPQNGDHAHDTASIRARLAESARPSYLRDWVYGGIDGAVTTFAVVAGVIGADLSVGIILALGCANLLADGFSMAAANFSGTRSEHQERARLREIERGHIAKNPDGERREVREIFRAKGFSEKNLDDIVDVISANEKLWVEVMLAEEYGQPSTLRDPLKAALVTFAAFGLAGAIPLAPFVLGAPSPGVWAVVCTCCVFFSVGALKSRWSLTHWTRSGLETLLIGGTAAAVAAVLILIGAATKSAQVPFHVWLPGAMAAPTPVSAYLHSATMVKAGVLLVAVVSPALGEVDAWRWTGLTFGIASMLWGAIGALRQRDAKLILAWGTVSQLGLLITLLTAGTAKATFAGVALLFAHALFKAALFLVVGEVDIRTGTRDIGELRGLRTSMPVAFWVTVAAAASMAGAPPLLGFAAKEAAVEAVLKLDGSLGVVVAAAVIGGAALTVAYTLRFVLGVFTEIATEAGAATTVAPLRPLMTAPSVVLAATGLLGFAVLGTVNDIILPAAVQLDPAAEAYKLYRYHGLTPALWSTVGAFVVGLPLGVALTRRVADAPRPLGARGFDRAVDGFLAAAPKAISKVQHGSLPVYLVTMSMVAAATTVPFWSGLRTDHLVVASSATEAVLALSVAIAAFAIGAVRSRLDAALALGAVGAGMTGLFVAIGAPDLALTQFLVETVIVIGFVGGLARLGRRFPPVGTTWRAVRVLVAAVSGVAVTLALIAAGAAPAGTAPIGRLADEAYETGGGKNIVNVILTDVRALDTVGEVVVLVAVSLGVLALAGAPLPRRSRAGDRHPAGPLPKVSTAADRLPESPVVRLGVELITPAAMLLGIYLLVAGHNRPGGGFAAGLVFGAVITLRALARMVIPPAIPLLGVGTAVVVASALLPLLWGDGVLDQGLATVDLPIFGSVKGGTALPFDIGVTAVVVGLIAALLHGLGDDMNDLDRLQETAS